MHKHLACTLGVIIFLGLWQGLNDKYSLLFYYSWQLCIWGEECCGSLCLSSLKSHHHQPPSHEELWDRQSVPGSGGNATVWHLTAYQQLTQLLFLKEKLQLFLFSVVICMRHFHSWNHHSFWKRKLQLIFCFMHVVKLALSYNNLLLKWNLRVSIAFLATRSRWKGQRSLEQAWCC